MIKWKNAGSETLVGWLFLFSSPNTLIRTKSYLLGQFFNLHFPFQFSLCWKTNGIVEAWFTYCATIEVWVEYSVLTASTTASGHVLPASVAEMLNAEELLQQLDGLFLEEEKKKRTTILNEH